MSCVMLTGMCFKACKGSKAVVKIEPLCSAMVSDVQNQNEATLKSKLNVDRRNADLQRRHVSLKEDAQHTQRALASSQVDSFACCVYTRTFTAKQSCPGLHQTTMERDTLQMPEKVLSC